MGGGGEDEGRSTATGHEKAGEGGGRAEQCDEYPRRPLQDWPGTFRPCKWWGTFHFWGRKTFLGGKVILPSQSIRVSPRHPTNPLYTPFHPLKPFATFFSLRRFFRASCKNLPFFFFYSLKPKTRSNSAGVAVAPAAAQKKKNPHTFRLHPSNNVKRIQRNIQR